MPKRFLQRRNARCFTLVEYCVHGGALLVRRPAKIWLPPSLTRSSPEGGAPSHAPVAPIETRPAATSPEQTRPVAAPGEPVRPAAAPQPAARGTAQVIISYVHYLGATKRTQSDEFVELVNLGDGTADLSGWRIDAGDPDQLFEFPPDTRLLPGARVLVFTDQEPTAPEHFSFRSKRALWNDEGDLGRLFDRTGTEISRYGYGDKETRTVASILRAHEVPRLQVLYDPQHLQEQRAYRGRIDFLTALERAIRGLLAERGGATLDAGIEPRDSAVKAKLADICNNKVLHRAHSAFFARQALRLLHAHDLPAAAQGRLRKEWLFRLEPGVGSVLLLAVDRSGQRPVQLEELPAARS